MVKKGTNRRECPSEFKISVIMDMYENHSAYRENVRKYLNTTAKAENSEYVNTVKLWERIFLEEGAEGLMKERRGRGNPLSEKRRGRPLKLDKKV